jgi:hypothetical protein
VYSRKDNRIYKRAQAFLDRLTDRSIPESAPSERLESKHVTILIERKEVNDGERDRNIGRGDDSAELNRQIEAEDFAAKDDDALTRGQLAKAAACYAFPERHPDPRIIEPVGWPFAVEVWNPSYPYGKEWKFQNIIGQQELRKSRISDLAKAGALIAREIDRIARRK